MSDTVIVSLTVTPVNDAPLAAADVVALVEDGSVTFEVRANDSDVEGDTLAAPVVVSGPANGLLTRNADGSIRYAPRANFSGTDTFTYQVSDGNTLSNLATVTLNVAAVNDLPQPQPDLAQTAEDTAISFDVRNNDVDADGDVLTVQIVVSPAHGSVAVNADGTVTYTPAANYFGADSFSYLAADGAVGPFNNPPVPVSITVTPVNDAPVARADNALVDEDSSVGFDLRANDSDVEGAVLGTLIDAGPLNGTLVKNADGSFTYTPNANFNGSDRIVYRATDGDADSAAAEMLITVRSVNDAPTAADAVVTLAEDSARVLVAADFGFADAADAPSNTSTNTPANTLLELLITRLPAQGRLQLTGVDINAPRAVSAADINAGLLRFVPAADANGTAYANMGFRVRDNGGVAAGGVDTSLAESTVIFGVLPVNDAPKIRPLDDVRVGEGEIVTLTMAVTDIDSGPPFAFAIEQGPAGATIDANGRLSWRATDGDRDYSFAIRATDSAGASDLTRFTVRVTNVGPTVLISGALTTRVGDRYEVALAHADAGGDPVLSWFIDWGDGSTDPLVPGANRATHIYSRPADQLAIRVTVVDQDGNWRIFAPYTLTVNAASNRGVISKLIPAVAELPTAPPVSVPAPGGLGFGIDLSVALVGQTAHLFSQAIALATVESLPTTIALPPGPITAEAMAALIESAPTAAGQPATLHVRSAVATGGGLRIRFSQGLDIDRLVRGTPAGEPLRPVDVFVLRNGAPVRGQIVIDPDGGGFVFVPEGGLLLDGDYSLVLHTANGSFATPAGQVLDGDHDGRPGGDFKARFNVQRPQVVGSAIGAPASGDTGLPWAGADAAAAAADSSWSVLGGLGGAATLMTSFGPWGAPARRRRGALNARTGPRANPQPNPQPNADCAAAGDAGAPVKVRMDGVDFGNAEAGRQAAAAPGWLAGWVDRSTLAPAANRWSIRL